MLQANYINNLKKLLANKDFVNAKGADLKEIFDLAFDEFESFKEQRENDEIRKRHEKVIANMQWLLNKRAKRLHNLYESKAGGFDSRYTESDIAQINATIASLEHAQKMEKRYMKQYAETHLRKVVVK